MNTAKGITRLSLVATAGAIGGAINSLLVWAFGVIGITPGLGVHIVPVLTSPWLYQRIVWGGIWGALFLLPFMPGKRIWQGVVYSLGPTLVQLFVVLPFQAHKGMMGLDLGNLTPLAVIFFNLAWGLPAAWWLRQAE